MATAIPFEMVFQTTAGTPVAGVKVYTYAQTTTTPQTAWSDTGLSVPVANPYIGDSAGYARFYLSSDIGYRIVARSADDSITYYDQEHPSPASGLDDALEGLAEANFTAGDLILAATPTTFVGAPQTGFARLAVANTFTKGQTIAVPNTETAESLINTVGTEAAPRAVSGTNGFYANRFVVHGDPDGTGGAIQAAIFAHSVFPTGDGAIAVGIVSRGEVKGDWAQDNFNYGAIGGWFDTFSTRGGTLFGAYAEVRKSVTAGGLARLLELDAFCSVDQDSLYGIEIVSTETNQGALTGTRTIDGGASFTDSAGIQLNVITGDSGSGTAWPYFLMAIKDNSGFRPAPITSTGAIMIAGGYSIAQAFNFRSLTATEGYIVGKNAQTYLKGRNAANSADVTMVALDASDRVTFQGGIIDMTTTGAMRTFPTIAFNYLTARPADSDNFISFRTGDASSSTERWRLGIDGTTTAEAGGTSGTDGAEFVLSSFENDGDFETVPFRARRDGNIYFYGMSFLTTANAANGYLDSGTGQLLRSTSSDDTKTGAEPLQDEFAFRVVSAVSDSAIYYRSLGTADNPEWGWYGVSANRLAEKVPQLATYQTQEARPVKKTRKVKKVIEGVRKVTERRKKQREVEREVVDPRDMVEATARDNDRKEALARGVDLPDDGWRPRTTTKKELQYVYTLVPETDADGKPVMEETPETDERGRYIIVGGKPKMRVEQRQKQVFEYEDVEVDEPYREEIEVDEDYYAQETVPLDVPKVTGAQYERMVVAACRVIDRLLDRVERLEARCSMPDFLKPDAIQPPADLADLIDWTAPPKDRQAALLVKLNEVNGLIGLAEDRGGRATPDLYRKRDRIDSGIRFNRPTLTETLG